MCVVTEDPILVNFFAQLAAKASENDISLLCDFFHIPVIFVEDEAKAVCTSKADIEAELRKYVVPTNKATGGCYTPTISLTMPLAPDIIFVQVNWQWKNQSGQVEHTRVASYTMQKSGVYGYDIVVAVNDDPVPFKETYNET
jgi:hypothetical protein